MMENGKQYQGIVLRPLALKIHKDKESVNSIHAKAETPVLWPPHAKS